MTDRFRYLSDNATRLRYNVTDTGYAMLAMPGSSLQAWVGGSYNLG